MWHRLKALDNQISDAIDKQIGGTYNTVPDGWREATEKDIAENPSFRIRPLMFVGIRQIFYHNDGKMTPMYPAIGTVNMFIFEDGTGYAMRHDYSAGKITYYVFGCEHDWTGDARADIEAQKITLYRMQHARKCAKCGCFETYDSSG